MAESDVKIQHCLNGFFDHFFGVAPFFVGGDQRTKLRAPIAGKTHSQNPVAQKRINVYQGLANYGGAQMMHAHGFGDIGG